MTAAKKLNLISEEEYLASEESSPVKREYLAGVVYAMSGVRIAHDIIAGNTYAGLHSRLRGQPCRPFSSDVKVRVRLRGKTYFYYPDVSVVCRSNPSDFAYQDEPVVIVEVLSKSTRRIDEGEKRTAYHTIPSLAAYLLVEQTSATVIVERRQGQDFAREVYEGLAAMIPLAEIQTELPLAEIYDGVQFVEEADEDAEE
jgi:Uma2 family endonuclease